MTERFWFAVLVPPATVAVAFSPLIFGYFLAMLIRGDCSPLWIIPMGLATWAALSTYIYRRHFS